MIVGLVVMALQAASPAADGAPPVVAPGVRKVYFSRGVDELHPNQRPVLDAMTPEGAAWTEGTTLVCVPLETRDEEGRQVAWNRFRSVRNVLQTGGIDQVEMAVAGEGCAMPPETDMRYAGFAAVAIEPFAQGTARRPDRPQTDIAPFTDRRSRW